MPTQGLLHPGWFNQAILGPRGVPSYASPIESAPAGTGSNEPAGFTFITSQSWDSIPSNGWYVDIGTLGNNMDLITDGTAPESPSGILRYAFSASFDDGGAAGSTEHTIIGGTKVYRRIVFRHSANWVAHNTGTNKMAFIWLNNSPMFFFNANGTGAGEMVGDLTFQNSGMGIGGEIHFLPNLGSGTLARGEWHTFETVIQSNTVGVADGWILGWIDGIATHDYQDLLMVTTGSNTWEYVSVYPIWGGDNGSTPGVDMTWDIDHDYVSNHA